jgi:type II secretory pathway pseudopilin PulG
MNIKFLKCQNPPPTSESGYTILEGIMAILMVTVMLTLVGPVIAFSVGTRVQAKRIELASQAAKTYVDSLRAGSLPPPVDNGTLYKDKLKKVLPPNSGQANGGDLDCNPETNVQGFCNQTKTLYCVSFDDNNTCSNESLVDMVVQAQACYPKDTTVLNEKDGYHLLVRVYRANAFGKLTDGFKEGKSDSSVTNALGNPALPLTTFTTYIVPDAENAFRSFQKSSADDDDECLKQEFSP